MRPLFTVFTKLLVLISTASLPLVSAAQSPCHRALTEAHLTHEQIRSIQAVRDQGIDLKVEVLVKTIDRQNHTVVLLGETHIAKEIDLQIGNGLVDEFEFIGIENGDDVPHDQRWSYWAFYPAFTLMLPGLSAIILWETANGAQLDSPMEHAKSAKNLYQLFSVEAGHKQRLRENIGLLAIGTLSLAQSLSWVNLALNGLAWIFAGEASPALIGASVATLASTAVVMEPLMRKTLATDRDVTMAGNLADFSDGVPVTLGIMGLGHLPGVIGHLTKSFGFTRIDLDGL